MIVSEADVQKSLDWLIENADASAIARAHRCYLEEYTRSIRAALMCDKPGESVAAQTRYADSHPDMKVHLLGLKQAIEEDERMRRLTASHEIKIEVWRSEQANARAQGRL